MKFKMEWDGILDYNGHQEIRCGIHLFCADTDKDALKTAYNFFRHSNFINWDAILESDFEKIYVISSD